MHTTSVAVFLCAVLVTAEGLWHQPRNPSVHLREGWCLERMVGRREVVDGVPVDFFLGLRYGRAERFESPVEAGLECWRTTNATQYTRICPQGVGYPRLGTESEDCLLLNVFRKSRSFGKWRKAPVLVYFYGGGWNAGTSNDQGGEHFVAGSDGDLVVVTVGYRLNGFGFLGSDSLRTASGSTGTLGLQDQRLALQWVQKYIRRFGGDPRQVTLMGHSAGAASIAAHMVMPGSRGLFHRAIMQSGFGVTWGSKPLEVSEFVTRQVVAAAGCNDTACLREVSMETLSAACKQVQFPPASYELNWGPTIDGVELTQEVWQSLQDGNFDKEVAVLAGTVRDEMAFPIDMNDGLFNFLVAPMTLDPTAGPQEVRAVYGAHRPVPAENPGNYSALWWTRAQAATDVGFFCPERRAFQFVSEQNNAPMYRYVFRHVPQVQTRLSGAGEFNPHGGELAFVWNCRHLGGCAAPLSPSEAALSKEMTAFFARFAAHGEPGGAWKEEYDPTTDSIFVIDIDADGMPAFHVEHELRTHECTFWDSQLPRSFTFP